MSSGSTNWNRFPVPAGTVLHTHTFSHTTMRTKAVCAGELWLRSDVTDEKAVPQAFSGAFQFWVSQRRVSAPKPAWSGAEPHTARHLQTAPVSLLGLLAS
ncbi:hypothetical protein NDU88_007858 [Pleurodeles waltl]|uniref:Uncharacterized protein n=1 Tax=Pleurodeles waltl TaxID=8319 RepID=A0AAV7PR76_PLEWA|nr:hypothetical protein NDU88_007858 [Pleurodeles waltl]